MLDKEIKDERKRKVDVIVDLYKSREYRQEDIAKKLGIPFDRVNEVLTDKAYEHTIEKTPENVKPGQKIPIGICFETMDWLDKYDF